MISSSVIEFLLIMGVLPLGGGRWVYWGGVGVGMWGCPMHYTHSCMHACTHMHKHTPTHIYVKHDKNGCLHVGSHLQFLYMCMHVHLCACVWGHPDAPRCLQIPPATCPLPRAAGSPKHQNLISLELIKIFQFCLKILYLSTFLSSYTL